MNGLWIAFTVALVWGASATVALVMQGWGQKIELAAINKVGKWYEHRVEELENETRQLAQQIIASTGHPGIAMPLQEPEPVYDYAFDDTGIIVERLDPRDVPLGQ